MVILFFEINNRERTAYFLLFSSVSTLIFELFQSVHMMSVYTLFLVPSIVHDYKCVLFN
jgi:hypothetical protein